MDLISKKELLAVTGISYGQLYRWKRQRLIPEAWFLKQSAYTGQETFFPRQQILSRVQTILDTKDSCSLEELAKRLSAEPPVVSYTPEELRGMAGLELRLLPVIFSRLGRERYDFFEVVLFAGASQLMGELALNQDDGEDLLLCAVSAARGLPKRTDLTLLALRVGEGIHAALCPSGTPVALDGGITVLGTCDLGALASRLKLNH